MGSIGITSCPLRDQVDPRALRFAAAATACVLRTAMRNAPRHRPVGRVPPIRLVSDEDPAARRQDRSPRQSDRPLAASAGRRSPYAAPLRWRPSFAKEAVPSCATNERVSSSRAECD